MDDFLVMEPCALLKPYVKRYWGLKTSTGPETQVRTFPTGLVTLVFQRGPGLQSGAFLCGHESGYNNLEYTGRTDMLCVVFKPHGARMFFRNAMDELKDRRVDIRDLEDTPLADFAKYLDDTSDPRKRVGAVERFLIGRLHSPAGNNLERVDAALGLISAGHYNVRSLADAACLGYKQFNRVFTEYVGAGPKEFIRVVRFQRAIYLMQTQRSLTPAALAYDCGYYDQSHLIKEFKAFSGYTPLEYTAAWEPYSDYFS